MCSVSNTRLATLLTLRCPVIKTTIPWLFCTLAGTTDLIHIESVLTCLTAHYTKNEDILEFR